MKKIYKIFMAVAAVVGVTACTTDATEDLGVKVGGQTTLTLSLDDTRTQLGDKADGTYALTWAEGDAISVNGSVSNALAADEAGATTATFTFENGFGSAPYFVAYPATSTNNQVVFAAEQTHKDNTTFDNGAAVMYGYTTDLSNVKLNHLTGVLKIGVVCKEGVEARLNAVRISTVDRKPIAGAFNVDAEGKLTATESATDVITYSLGEGEILDSATPTYIHVAVPAGVYGELYVTLEAETYKEVDYTGTWTTAYSYKTVTTDNTKPVNAGTVREFSNNIEFVPTDEAEVFVISSYADLYEFKEDVEAAQIVIDNAEATEDAKAEATATLAKSVILVNDIQVPVEGDMLIGKDWAPINAPAYAAEFNGNGYAIKGLYAPLFDTVAATIKGVHLKDVKITKATTTNTGALVNTYKGSNISHCSVSGQINVTLTSDTNHYVAGMIGVSIFDNKNVAFNNCENNCEINVNLNRVETATDSTNNYTTVAGLVGRFDNSILSTVENGQDNIFTLTLENNQNKAAINITGNGSKDNMYVGGLYSRIGCYLTTDNNSSNSGNITVNVGAANPIRLGGLIAEIYNNAGNKCRYRHFTATDCSNSGNMKATVSTTSVGTSNTAIGGLFGQLYNEEEGNIKLANCDNSGNVEFYGAPSSTNLTTRVDLGGIVGIAIGRVNITNCDNIGEKVYANIGTHDRYIAMGGISGRSAVSATNNNTSSSNLVTYVTCTNTADVSCYVAKSKSVMAIGGITGEWYCLAGKYRLTMNGCVNEGNLLSSCDAIEGDSSRTLIGFVGSTWTEGTLRNMHYKGIHKFEITNCRNGKADKSNTMTVTGKAHRHINAGGLMGYCYNHFTVDGCTNNMSYIYNCDETSNVHYYGGLYGRMYQQYHYETTASDSNTLGTVKLWFNVKDFTNNGNATLSITNEAALRVSKLVASTECEKMLFFKLGKVTCNGDLTITKKGASATYTALHVGGLIASMSGAATTEYDTSDATIAINGNLNVTGIKPATTTATTYIGGAVGNFTRDLANITVNGTMTVDEGVAAGMLAGVASTGAKTFTNCKVGGKFVEGTTETTLDSTNFVKYLFSDRVLTSYADVTLVE